MRRLQHVRRFCAARESSWTWYDSRQHLEAMINSDSEPAALAEHLEVSPITKLEMYVRAGDEEFGISEQGVASLAEALATNKTVTQLVLYGEGLGADAANAVAASALRSTALTRLALYGAPIGHSGGAALGAALARDGAALAELDLDFCTLGASGTAALAESLASNATLGRLNLQGSSIIRGASSSTHDYDDAGVAGLASLLTQLTPLRHLSLPHNELGDDDVMTLAHALQSNTSLKYLDLSGNHLLSDRSHAALGSLFEGGAADEQRPLAVHLDAIASDQSRGKRVKKGKTLSTKKPVEERKFGLFLNEIGRDDESEQSY